MNERPSQKLRRRKPPRLPARARWTLRGLVALPLLSLTVASGFYFRSVYHLLRANLVPIAESELTRQTGHEVRIGTADFSQRGELILTDVAISNKATFAAGHGEASLSARRLTVGYDLHSLLFDSGNAAHAIGDVTLDQPVVLVERLSGSQFNFSDLLQPKSTKKSKPFVGRILVHRGLLRFRDFQAPANVGFRPALNTLSNVEGSVDLGSERTVYFDVRGRGTGVRFASLAVTGDVSRQGTGRYRGHVIVADADAAYWAAYFKAFPQARITSGRADVDVSIAKLAAKPAPGLPLDLSGRVAVRHVSILASNKKILAQPLQDLTGTASFTGAGLSIDANALVAGQRLLVAGTVFDFTHPQIAFSASSPRLDPARLASALPVLKLPPGFHVSPGPIHADFTGTAADPTITIRATLPALVYAGNQATNVIAQAVYANKILSIPSVTFRLNGTGQVALRGTVDTTKAKPVLLVAGHGAGCRSGRPAPAAPASAPSHSIWAGQPTRSSWRTTRAGRFRSWRTSARRTCVSAPPPCVRSLAVFPGHWDSPWSSLGWWRGTRTARPPLSGFVPTNPKTGALGPHGADGGPGPVRPAPALFGCRRGRESRLRREGDRAAPIPAGGRGRAACRAAFRALRGRPGHRTGLGECGRRPAARRGRAPLPG